MRRIHPNTILMAVIKLDNITRETVQDVISECASFEEKADVEICGRDYSLTIMEYDYDGKYQIMAKRGDVVIHDFITYGYGDKISWEKVERQKNELEGWCKMICEKHCGNFEIFISANYS